MLDRLIDFILGFIELFKFWRVIPVNKRGVKTRWGVNPVELKSGFHFVLPFEIDHVQTFIVEPEWGSSTPVYFTTSDLKTAVVMPCVKYKIIDTVAWAYAENDALSNLYEVVAVSTLEVLSDCDWKECLQKTTYTKIKNKIKSRSENLGVEVIDFTLQGLSLCRLLITKL